MEVDQCRMCGDHRDRETFVDIEQLRDLINYHCRIHLIFHSSLSNSICGNCDAKIKDFSLFCEQAKENQIKLLTEHNIQNVKMEENEESPFYFDDNKQTRLFIDEPKVEIVTGCDPVVNEEAIECDLIDEASVNSNSECEWKNESSSSSDSEFLADIRKRVKSDSGPRKKRGRPKKVRSTEDCSNLVLDISEEARDFNGTIKEEALTEYEGKKWCDINMKCSECEHVAVGPFELRSHYFLFHTLDLQYQCTECSETLSYFYQFLNHFIDHRQFLNFCCVICSQMFWNTRSLNQHYKSTHKNAEQALKHCKRCGQHFRKPIDLTNHEMLRHKIKANHEGRDLKSALYTVENLFSEEWNDDNFKQNKEFDVPDCDKNADGSVSDICNNRYKSIMWNNVMVQECSDCNAQFKSPYLLYLHFNASHLDKKTNFLCKLCSEEKNFLNFEALVNHTFTIHHDHLRYFCFICCNGFWDYKALYNHYKNEHEDYNVFLCIYCGKHHKVGYELRHHIKIHKPKFREEKEEKREKSPGIFTCNDCPRTFPKKTHLQRHAETHKKSENKMWICEQCGKNFNAKSTLINHAMVHMNIKPFVCNICGEAFKNKYKLNYHKGIHTGEKNFGCEVCGQRFRAKGTLKNHMMTHTGERPWSCEFCDKKFSAKYDLNVHTRLHTGEFSHECPICHERYPSWSNYSKHMRGRHQIDPRSEKKKKYDALRKEMQEKSIAEEESQKTQQYFS